MLSFQLYRILNTHYKLAEKRSPMYNQGKVARFLAYLSVAIGAIYLIVFSIIFSLTAQDIKTMTAYEFMYSIIPFIFLFDFYIRFAFMQTPTQFVKPYVLMPIPKMSCIDFFIARQLLAKGNLIWMIMYIPFAIMSIIFSEGVITTILFLLSLFIIELISSQVYSIIRSMINQNALWWILAIILVVAVFSPAIINGGSSFDSYFNALFEAYSKLGNGLCNGNIIAWCAILGLLTILIQTNRKLQYSLVYKEISKNTKSITANPKSLGSISKYGLTWKFITLEFLSIKRNLNVRKLFLNTNLLVLVFSLLCSFTTVYDNLNGTYFWALYNFSIYGNRMLIHTMSYDGNYIESLLTTPRSLEHLLRAKYYIYSSILIIPLILMLPCVFVGKMSIIMLASFMLFTAGVDNLLFLAMTIFNKQTMPLNDKVTGKVTIENNWIIIAVGIGAFFGPFIFINIMSSFDLLYIANIILALLGLVFIFSHKFWISKIYERFKIRKYTTLESLISTRQT